MNRERVRWLFGMLAAVPVRAGLLLAVGVYWICAMRHVEMPGLYMDAINPDYLVARWLQPELANPAWIIPGPSLPLLGNLYHGTQNLYVGLLTYGVLGTSVISARITHALFGAAIVMLVYLLLRRMRLRPWIALLAAAGLGTDMAFIGAFRTQAYIILGGQAWMLAALYFAMRARQPLEASVASPASTPSPSKGSLMASGLFMGLAVYGYFVHLFFLPVVALLAVSAPGFGLAARRAGWWAGGFAIGMLPYVVGYAWLIASLGGWAPFQQWLHDALASLKPMGGSSDYLSGLGTALHNSGAALAGIGNESMMTGKSLSTTAVKVRAVLLVIGLLACIAGAWRLRRSQPARARMLLAVAALPASYVLLAAIFGQRLWLHHFTVLVAVSYLALAVAMEQVIDVAHRFKGAAVAIGLLLGIALLAGNVAQQDRVFAQLAKTGGFRTSSEMLDPLARSALAERGTAVYFFPDWGFFMPFAFLTTNRVAYETDFSQGSLARHRGLHDDVRVAFWELKDRDRHQALLEAGGIQDIKLYVFAQRDGVPAFYLLAGHGPAPR